ncbi:arylacetamide deacetylase-like 4 [Brachionus plicatilis]|uniref:Arylacetamide deacetylase-like 4 n=1 Tax=Brachionus plicatilis TaxID=10195 RepID=A0A3M7PQS0_BRAPC|nr:arylacetamide deacetylase-like 4 [Brachionus plicatilis]
MNDLKTKTTKAAIAILFTGCLFQLINQPLPDDFEQPWKYRLICFGAELSNILGYFTEKIGILHRVNVTRFSYHISVGSFNIRDHNDNISVHDEIIEHLSIRIYRPMGRNKVSNKNKTLPAILFYHGGGYFVGSADTLEPVTYLMAKYTQYLVIYIEYRLIPEHQYPAAFHDSLQTAIYLIKNHAKYSIDLNNLIIMGDSAGGNLATVIGQQLIEHDIIKPKMQVLIYPVLQFFDFTLPSYVQNLPKRILGSISQDNFKNFFHYFTGVEVDDTIFLNGHTTAYQKESKLARYVSRIYLPKNHLSKNSRMDLVNDTYGKYNKLSDILLSNKVSPLLVDDSYLGRNTPDYTILLTAGIDMLRDDGFIYAARLKEVGKKIEHMHFENLFHGIFGLLHGPLEFTRAKYLVNNVAEHIKKIVAL